MIQAITYVYKPHISIIEYTSQSPRLATQKKKVAAGFLPPAATGLFIDLSSLAW